MAKFKVGDIVIGNEKANSKYVFTIKGWEGKVTDIDGISFDAESLTTRR